MKAFVCPKCHQRKDDRKKNNQSCLDCFSKAKLHKQGKKSREEELKEREDSLQKREEHILEGEKWLAQKHAEVLKREQVVIQREQGVRIREAVVEAKEKRERETSLKRKRQEEGPTGSQKRCCDLGERQQQRLVTAAVEELKVLSRGEVKVVLGAVAQRVLGKDDAASQVQALKANIAAFCATQLPTLPDRCRIAAALTKGLALDEAEQLTGVALSSISWGRHEIQEGRLTTQEVLLAMTSRKNIRQLHLFIDVAISASSPGSSSRRT